jgi:hypothetical protein
MNCFELRRRKLAAPRELNAEAQAHLKGCPACAAFVERLAEFEEALEHEVRIPVPDGLADRVLLHVRQQTDVPRAQPSATERVRALAHGINRATSGFTNLPWGRRIFAAVAALLILGIGIVLFHASPIPDEALAIADIAHVAHVAQERIQDLDVAAPGDPGALPKVLADSGVRLPSDFQEVRYLGRCGPADRSGQHIVMQTQSGMVSLVLMPGESARFRIVQFDDGRTAVVGPARIGSLAVVADSRQAAVQIAERLL